MLNSSLKTFAWKLCAVYIDDDFADVDYIKQKILHVNKLGLFIITACKSEILINICKETRTPTFTADKKHEYGIKLPDINTYDAFSYANYGIIFGGYSEKSKSIYNICKSENKTVYYVDGRNRIILRHKDGKETVA